MEILCKRLRAAKNCCKSLNRSSFSNIQKRSSDAFEKLEIIQRQVHSAPTQALFELEKVAQDEWTRWSGFEETFFFNKSRVRWFKEGDANTKFFHNSVKANLAKNLIHHLRDNNDIRISDPGQIKSMVVDYYKSLLGTRNSDVSPYSVEHIQSLHDFRCSSDLAALLTSMPTTQEIKSVLFRLPRNKAPGPDGFSPEFFIDSWDLVGSDFVAAVAHFFYSSRLLRQVNATALVLIPKVIGSEKLSDFRPISCCNTVYKVISHILASRIKLFLDQVVQNNQVGFMSGRLLCENVLLASELVYDFHKPGPTTRGCLQIDLSKAYDNVDWGFLINILKAYELPEVFIGWVTECFSSACFSISLNGELVGFFPGKKGLRQGDPMSSSLFVLSMDILAKDIDRAARSHRFIPHPLGFDPLLTHLSFADDVLIFFDGTEFSLAGILDILRSFYTASGLHLNLGKSSVFIDGNNSDRSALLASQFGIMQGSLPVKYLGLPLLPHKMKPADYQPLLDKVYKRINQWTVRHLSFAGRLQLIQAVIFSLINFWATVFPLPKKCMAELERMCSAFLWKGISTSARGARVSWDSVCTPKEVGGLGFKRLEAWNKVFSLKLIWLLFTKGGSLWVSWVKKHLISGRVFWDLPTQNHGSWLWKQILKIRPLARPHLSCHLGSGKEAFFWHDDWTNLGPLLEITGDLGTRVTGIDNLAKVYQVIQDNRWLVPSGRNSICALLRACLPPVPTLNSDEADSFQWRNSLSSQPGIFNSALTWTGLHPRAPQLSWTSAVWFHHHIPKHAFMHWLVMRDRLPTRDRLIRWGLITDPLCLLCGGEDESKDHLFFDCSVSTQIWQSLFTHQSLNPPTGLERIVRWVRRASSNTKITSICNLILQAVIYEVWKERNTRLHQGTSRSVLSIVKGIQLTMRRKLLILDRNQRSEVNPSSTSTYLSIWFDIFQNSTTTTHH